MTASLYVVPLPLRHPVEVHTTDTEHHFKVLVRHVALKVAAIYVIG